MLIRSEKALEAFGERLARRIVRQAYTLDPKPYTLALVGELGSGKTTFVRGFARGLGIRKKITSPTFVLARRYRLPRVFEIRDSSFEILPRYFWHLDLYRLRGLKDLDSIGFRDILEDPQNIVAIEWADRMRRVVPKGAVWITFRHHRPGRTASFKKSKAQSPKLK